MQNPTENNHLSAKNLDESLEDPTDPNLYNTESEKEKPAATGENKEQDYAQELGIMSIDFQVDLQAKNNANKILEIEMNKTSGREDHPLISKPTKKSIKRAATKDSKVDENNAQAKLSSEDPEASSTGNKSELRKKKKLQEAKFVIILIQ